MANIEQAMEALRRAHDAGNTEDARRLAGVVRKLRDAQPGSFSGSDYAQSFLGGFNRGVTNMAGAPVDLVNLGLKQVGMGSERPIGGSRQLREDIFESTETGQGMIDPGATDPLGRTLSRTGEEIGASTLPAAAITGAAVRTAPTLRGIWSAFANPIRNAPARASMGELAAATGAGLGAGIAQEAAPGSQLAETTGQIVGGLAPTALLTTPTALATRGAVNTLRKVSPAAQQRAGRDAVSDMLDNELTPEMGARLSEADRLRERMPGFEPSLGEATGSQPLLAQQSRVEGMASGSDLARLSDRKAGSEMAVSRFAAKQAPGGPGGPDFIIDSASRSLDDMRAGVAGDEGALTRDAQDIAAGLPSPDRAAAGQTLRQKLLDARVRARTQLDARADELGINQVDLTLPFDEFKKDLLADLVPKSVFEDASNFPSVIDDLKSLADGQTVSFQDIKALRERISDDLTDVMSGAAPNRKKARVLTLMKQRLDGFVDGLDGEFGQAADGWREFRKEYAEQYIDRFENGVAFKVRQKDGRGFYRTPDEKIASTFFDPGNTSAAKQYRKVYGGDQEANAALEAVALDSLRQSAVRDGTIKPGLMQAWMRRHESVLNEYPAIRQAVDDIQKAQQSIDARQAQIAARSRDIEDKRLSRELDAFSRKTRTAEDVLDLSVLGDPRRTEELMSFLKGKPEAQEALKRHLWEGLTTDGSEAILARLRDNADSLKLVFKEQHLKDMADIALAKAMLERTGAPRGSAAEPRVGEALEDLVGQGLPQLGSRIFAWRSGRMQKGYLAVDTVMRGLRGRAAASADEILRTALYDPDVARDLAGAIRAGELTPERASRLQARLFALGVPYTEDE